MIIGASGSGKTYWVYRFLKNLPHMFSDGNAKYKVMYCYGVYQSLFDEMKSNLSEITFHHGLPDLEEIEHVAGGHSLLILDDLMSQVTASKTMEDLFCQYCHHKKISVMFLTQNLFQQGKCARTIALNTHVLILMKNMRNASQISCFARQLYPNRRGMLEEIYEDVMQVPFSYLVVDMSPGADDSYRLRTNIFPEEHPLIYIPKKL